MPTRFPTISPEPVTPIPPEAAARLARLRRLAFLMDRSIPIGGGRSIGLDPLIGLIPGVGDWAGAVISSWIVYQGILLGMPLRVLVAMGLNIAIEALVGTVPVVGDLFDAAWQANYRNLRLIEKHYDPRRRPRSLRGVLFAFAVCTVLFFAAIAALSFWIFSALLSLVTSA